jgi:hypothetical protein
MGWALSRFPKALVFLHSSANKLGLHTIFLGSAPDQVGAAHRRHPLGRYVVQALLSAAFSSLNLWCWARISSCVAPWFGTFG